MIALLQLDVLNARRLLRAADERAPREACGIARGHQDATSFVVDAVCIDDAAWSDARGFTLSHASEQHLLHVHPTAAVWWHSHADGPLWPSREDRAALGVGDLLLLCRATRASTDDDGDEDTAHVDPRAFAAFVCTAASVRPLPIVFASHRQQVGPR